MGEAVIPRRLGSKGLIFSFNINHQLYADDEVYMSLSVLGSRAFLKNLQHCLMGVSAWMTESKLKLYPVKTKSFFFLCPNFNEKNS